MSRKAYPTDLSDSEWLLLEALLFALLPPSKRGKKRTVELREIVNAIFYVLRSGCAGDQRARHDKRPEFSAHCVLQTVGGQGKVSDRGTLQEARRQIKAHIGSSAPCEISA